MKNFISWALGSLGILAIVPAYPARSVAAEVSEPYSATQFERFEELREGPFVSKGNFLVPRRQSVAEAEDFHLRIAETNRIREAIEKGKANRQEIERYFKFREMTLNFRLQLIHALHVERGGTLSRVDPNLELGLITDGDVRRHFEAYLEDQKTNYRDHQAAIGSLEAFE